ncbi:MAG TPA: DUF6585 family protein [Actinocrinis sp.]|jgi:hypothetical protein
MSTEPLAPGPPPPAVGQLAEREELGEYQRVLTKYRKHVFKPPEFVYHVFDFDRGIVFQGKDGVLHAYPWGRVATVYLGSTRHYSNGQYTLTTFGFSVILGNGNRLRLSGAFHDHALRPARNRAKPVEDEEDLFGLASAVATAVSRQRLPDAIAALERGDSLTFGDIGIGLAGVRTTAELIPWSAIKEVEVAQGVVRIKQAGRFRPLSRKPASEIPNVQLFILLAKTLHGRMRQ